ncbi:MAG: S1-like domain-containing RNA-binding protein [Bacteroidota bacterium]
MEIGRYYELEVAREVDFGMYLNSDLGDILLPQKYIAEGTEIGTQIRVFVYKDTEDRLIATTEDALGEVGDIVSLEVVDKTPHGAFMHWGLIKDLFVPKKEQPQLFNIGERHIVRICLDYKTDRLIGTGKITGFLKKDKVDLKEGQEVEALIYAQSDLGYKTVVNQKYSGLIYANEVYDNVTIGDQRKAYVKRVREDGKVDLSLKAAGKQAIDADMEVILDLLRLNNNKLPYHDKSSPEEIKYFFKLSKKAFKKAVGGLLKKELIKLDEKGIETV